MAIFNSYVKLPDGKHHISQDSEDDPYTLPSQKIYTHDWEAGGILLTT